MFYGDRPDRAPAFSTALGDETPRPITGDPASWGEVYGSTWDSMFFTHSSVAEANAVEAAYDAKIDRIFAATGPRLENPRRSTGKPVGLFAGEVEPYPDEAFAARLRELEKERPDLRDVIAADRPIIADARLLAREKERFAADVWARSGGGAGAWTAYLAGGFTSAFSDPINLAALPFGFFRAGLGARGLAMAAIKNGAVNAGAEAAIQPFVQAWRREAGLDYGVGQAATDTAFAFLFGGALDLGVRGGIRGVQAARGREAVTDAGGMVTGWRRPQDALEAAAKAAPDDALLRKAAEGDPQAIRDLAAATGLERDPAVRGGLAEMEAESLFPPPEGVSRAEGLSRLNAAIRHELGAGPPPGDAIPTPPVRRGADLSNEAGTKLGEGVTVEGKPVAFRAIPAKDITADAATFQFKGDGDASGVTQRLQGVTRWDPMAAGKAVVYERLDGRMVIADGHQRLGLAKRLADQNPELHAFVFREADGWTPADVRAYAALKNLKELSGSSVDMARAMRERPDLIDGSLPLSDGKMREAIHLSRLSQPAFDAVVGGRLPPHLAALVGESVTDGTRHAGLLDELARADLANAAQARFFLAQIMALPTTVEHQITLFGEEIVTRSVMLERAKVLDAALKTLRDDKRIFGLLEREAAAIERRGNQLNREGNAARAQNAAQLAELIEKLSVSRGPVATMLNDAALAVARGMKAAAAGRAFVSRIADILERDGVQGFLDEAPDAAGGAAARLDDPAGTEAKAQADALEAAQKTADEAAEAEAKARLERADAEPIMFALPGGGDGQGRRGRAGQGAGAPGGADLDPGRPRQGGAGISAAADRPAGATGLVIPDGAVERVDADGFELGVIQRLPGKDGLLGHRRYRALPVGLPLPRDAKAFRSLADQRQIGEMIIKERFPGRWEIEYWEAPGIGSRLMDAVEAHLGAPVHPSGTLTQAGYKFQARRNPDLIQHYQWSAAHDLWLSPRWIAERLAELKALLKNQGKSPRQADLDERGLLQQMWRKVPKKAKTPEALDAMFALPGFYSPAIRAAEGLSMKKGTAEQFLKQIEKTPGVKQEELEWIGVREWLAEQKGPVEKADIVAFMRAHQVEVDERLLSDAPLIAGKQQLDAIYQEIRDTRERLGLSPYGRDDPSSPEVMDATARYEKLRDELEKVRVEEGVRYQSYKISGGENYRELLIRFPKLKGEYNSKHFSDQEVAHIRFDERAGPSGERVLFLHEVQSDLHQAGRKSGYRKPDDPAPEGMMTAKELKAELESISSRLNEISSRGQPEEWRRLQMRFSELSNREYRKRVVDPRLADAPFKGDAWLDLALKRMLLYAIENGYDAVSWARSDQIAKAVGAQPKNLALQYDQKIGRFYEKYTKKWGGKVEQAGGIAPTAQLAKTPEGINGWTTVDNSTKPDFVPGGKNPILRITPEMRASVKDGLPLFSVPGGRAAAAAAPSVSPRAATLSAAAQVAMPEMRAAIDAAVSKALGPKWRAHVRDQLVFGDLPAGLRARNPGVPVDLRIEGVADPYERIIYVSLASQDALERTYEEIGHTLRKAIPADDYDRLLAAARETGAMGRFRIEERYGELYARRFKDEAMRADKLQEEAVMQMFAAYQRGERFGKAADTIFAKIKKLVDAVLRALGGKGLRTYEDVFEDMAGGRYAEMEKVKPGTALDPVVTPPEYDRRNGLAWVLKSQFGLRDIVIPSGPGDIEALARVIQGLRLSAEVLDIPPASIGATRPLNVMLDDRRADRRGYFMLPILGARARLGFSSSASAQTGVHEFAHLFEFLSERRARSPKMELAFRKLIDALKTGSDVRFGRSASVRAAQRYADARNEAWANSNRAQDIAVRLTGATQNTASANARTAAAARAAFWSLAENPPPALPAYLRAVMLDDNKVGRYYSDDAELFARSFEVYVADAAIKKGYDQAAVEAVFNLKHDRYLNSKDPEVPAVIDAWDRIVAGLRVEDGELKFALPPDAGGRIPDLINEAAAKGDISRDEAARLIERYRMLEAHHRSAPKAGEALAKELTAEELQARRQEALQREADARIERFLRDFRDERGQPDPARVLLALIESDGRVKMPEGFASVQGRSKALLGSYMAEMEEALHAFRRKTLSGRTRNRARLDNVVRELFGEGTGDAEAAHLASVWKKTAERARQEFNAAGGAIGKRDDWGLPQAHDALKLIRAGKARWIEAITPMLDIAPMRHHLTGEPMTPADLRVSLDWIYDEITTNGWHERDPSMQPMGRGKLANQRGESRFLVFKTADDWMRYQGDFGAGGNPFHTMMRHLQAMAKDTAAMQILGPNPAGAIERLKQTVLQQAERRAAGMPAHFPAVSVLFGRERRADKVDFIRIDDPGGYARAQVRLAGHMWDFYRGQAGAVRGSTANIFEGARNINTAALLGSAPLSALPTDPVFQTMARKFAGLPAANLARQIVTQIASLKNRRDAVRAGLIMESALETLNEESRFFGSMTGPQWTRYLSDRTMNLSGLAGWTRSMRHVWGMNIMAEMASRADEAWGALPERFREFMQRYGLSERDWDAIRSLRDETGETPDFIAPSALARAAREAGGDETLALRVQEMILQEMEYSTPSGNLQAQARAYGGLSRGVVRDELYRSFSQFKMFGISLFMMQMQRIATTAVMRGAGSAALWASGMAIGMTLGGALATQIKDIANGRDPRPVDNGKFWLGAFVQGGGFGIFSDFLFAEVARSGNGLSTTLTGPTVGTASQAIDLIFGNIYEAGQGKRTNAGREAVRFLNNVTPGSSLWYLRLVWQRALMETLQRELDPEASDAFRRIQQQRRREYGQEFWWAPGRRAPDRAPALP